jgi:ABC-type nitrate/sulfonate/bicarbonate transport system substrate-binding protein
MPDRRLGRAIGLLAVAGILGGCQPGPSPAVPVAGAPPRAELVSAAPPPVAPTVMHYNIVGKTAPYWNIFTMVEKGFMSAEGIDLQTESMPARVGAAALLSGAIEIGSQQIDTLVLSPESGDLVGIGSEVETPIYSLVGGPNVSGAADLKDRPVMTGASTGVTAVLLVKLTAALGLRPSDYQTFVAGNPPERYAALQSGRVAAALLPQPVDLLAIRQGFKLLARSPDVVPDLHFTLFVALRPWLQQHRDVAVRFLRGAIRAVRWLYEPANRAEAEALLVQETGIDADTASAVYDLYLRDVKVYSPDVAPVLRHLQGNIDLLVELQSIEPPGPNPQDYLDLGPLREAEASLAGR